MKNWSIFFSSNFCDMGKAMPVVRIALVGLYNKFYYHYYFYYYCLRRDRNAILSEKKGQPSIFRKTTAARRFR